jgi:acetyl-CoA carboxylase carboxyl transferase subunit beta
VVPEPDGGTGADPLLAADRLRQAVSHSLGELVGLTAAETGAHRRARFRRFGSAATVEAEHRSISEEVR